MLQGEDTAVSTEHTQAERKTRALKILGDTVPDQVREAFWRELNVVYHAPHARGNRLAHCIARRAHAHDRTRRRSQKKRAHGRHPNPFYLPDRKDLFLRAVAAIGKCSLSVVDARVHTTRHGWALDTFLVTDRYEREDEEASERSPGR